MFWNIKFKIVLCNVLDIILTKTGVILVDKLLINQRRQSQSVWPNKVERYLAICFAISAWTPSLFVFVVIKALEAFNPIMK